MPYFSSIVATFFGLSVAGLIANGNFAVGTFWRSFAVCYAIIGVGAGWWYVGSRTKVAGWIHSALMLGVAALCGYSGLSIFGDRSIAGGRGPDANPVAGIIYGAALLEVVVAVIAGVCGVGVLGNVLRRKIDEKPSAQPDHWSQQPPHDPVRRL